MVYFYERYLICFLGLAIHMLCQFLIVFLLAVKFEVHNVTLVLRNFLVIANVNLLSTLTGIVRKQRELGLACP